MLDGYVKLFFWLMAIKNMKAECSFYFNLIKFSCCNAPLMLLHFLKKKKNNKTFQ